MSQLPEERIKRLALEGGASVVGIASVSQINQYVPPEHRPDDILGRARSVVVVGSPRYTSGTWLTAHTEVLHRARVAISARDSLALNIARFIERHQTDGERIAALAGRKVGLSVAGAVWPVPGRPLFDKPARQHGCCLRRVAEVDNAHV